MTKAVWYVESHFSQDTSLAEIARVAGVSRFHLSRVFGIATGHSVLGYVRARRLTEAARRLAAGAPDILAVALDFGYGSHEAFTRAFRDQFGLAPEALRAQGNLDNILLQEAIKMNESPLVTLAPPRFEEGRALLIAGLSERYNSETCASIPSQWQRFGPHIGNIPGQIGRTAYGVLHNGDDEGNIEYLTGVEVSNFARVPSEFDRLRIPPHRYAVFTHRDHISAIRRTWMTILNEWLPASELAHAQAPEFELYSEEFDPQSGTGLVEIWIPVKTRE